MKIRKILFPILVLLIAGAVYYSRKVSRIVLQTPRNGEQVELLQPEQLAFLRLPRAERIAFFVDQAKRDRLAKTNGHPQFVTFSWRPFAGATEYTFWCSTSPDFQNVPLLKFTIKVPQITIGNFRIATTYYWKVTANGKSSAVRTFRTADTAPRILYVEGVDNVRDLGGRLGLNGRRVRQNRIFRTSQYNEGGKPIFKNDKELLQDPDYAAEQQTAARIAGMWKEILAGKQTPAPCTIGKTWTAFIPDQKVFTEEENRRAVSLTAIPATLNGAAPQTFIADANGECVFPRKYNRQPVILFQEFTAERDGLMPFQCGADWYWQLAVNGQVVCNRLDMGNKLSPRQDNHCLPLPVRKGKNILCVIMIGGDHACKWCHGAFTCSPAELQNIAQKLTEQQKQYRQRRKMVLKGYHPGKNTFTPASLSYMLNTLKIKTDLDLRSPRECGGITASPLGPAVRRIHISAADYGNMQKPFGKEAFAECFKLFLDEKNYPIAFHCVHGRSRTGSLAFILNGLLGVDEDELYRDWEATAFSNPSLKFSHERRFNGLIKGFLQVPGVTMNAKIENYVLSAGFTPADIAKFREMMLEPARLHH